MACTCQKISEEVGGLRIVRTIAVCQECQTKRGLETAGYLKIQRKNEILAELNALDAKSIRPLRAKIAGTATKDDEDILASINTKIVALRKELSNLA